MISLNTNITDLIMLNSLNSATGGINKTIERLTTGYKLNHAKDNAANLSIVTSLSTKINSLLKVKSNTEDGISLLSTAQEALENIQDQLSRLRALSIQAANGNYGEQSLEAMQAEADEIIEQIKQIRNNTEFNGLKLFESTRPISANETTTVVAKLSNAKVKMRTSARSAAVPYASNLTYIDSEGAIAFAGNETKTVNICGITYTLKNTKSSSSSLSYVKDKSSGQITFVASNFEITAQKDVSHNIVINGVSNIIRGGDLDDVLADFSISSNRNKFYGGLGNDNITLQGYGSYAYGEDGDDTITSQGSSGYQYIFGGNGNDTINVNAVVSNVNAGDGNDIININSSSGHIYGEDGDDIFNFISDKNNIVDGGAGNNVSNGTISDDSFATNMTGENCKIVEFNRNDAKDIVINGINYNVKASNQGALIYKVNDDGQIEFNADKVNIFTIKGQADKQHNVHIKVGMTFYGGDLADNITVSKNAHNSYIYGLGGDDTLTNIDSSWVTLDGGDGNDTITTNTSKTTILGGKGNDIIIAKGHSNSINTGDGNDTVTISSGANSIYSSSGTNTLIDNSKATTNLICGFGSSDNSSVLKLNAKETKSLSINNITYSITNDRNSLNFMLYKHNTVTNKISFGGNNLTVKGQTNVAHDVILSGTYLNFYGGDLDDTITTYTSNSKIYGGNGNDIIDGYTGNQNTFYGEAGDDIITSITGGPSTIYGGDGNDTITIDVSHGVYEINGGNGDDTYNINASAQNIKDDGGNNIYNINVNNTTIEGAEGNDTFYVSGNNNNIIASGGDDYVVLDGSNNTIDGGAGNNYYIDNGTNNIFTNVNKDPNSGMLVFTYAGEVKTFELDGKTYTVTNQNADGTAPESNQLRYSFNPNTGTITLDGSDLTVDSNLNKTHKLNIRGDNNTVNGGNLSDVITIEQGTNNIVNALGGNDTINMNSSNNSINGGDGNDTITLNSSSDKLITGGNGDDTIVVNSSDNTNINTGTGNDKITLNGANNTVELQGNNTVNVRSDGNTINADDGDNNFSIAGSSNTISAGNGANKIGIDGSNNEITVGNAVGDVNIYGEDNSYTSQNGDENILINGSNNTVSSGAGNDTIEVRGDNNTVSTTDGDNEVNIRGNGNAYQGGSGVDDIKVSGDRNILNGGDSNDTYMISKGNNNVIDGEAGSRNTMINNGKNTQFTNVVDITPRPFELQLKVDLGTSETSFINLSISFNLFDFYLDLNPGNLEENLAKLDDLNSQVEEQLLNIGSHIDRLTTVLESQSIQMENLISTRSTLRDADIAEESSNFIKYQILQQASATLMASTREINREFILGILAQPARTS